MTSEPRGLSIAFFPMRPRTESPAITRGLADPLGLNARTERGGISATARDVCASPHCASDMEAVPSQKAQTTTRFVVILRDLFFWGMSGKLSGSRFESCSLKLLVHTPPRTLQLQRSTLNTRSSCDGA